MYMVKESGKNCAFSQNVVRDRETQTLKEVELTITIRRGTWQTSQPLLTCWWQVRLIIWWGVWKAEHKNHFHFACAKVEDPSSKLNHQGAGYMNSEHGTLERCLATNRGESWAGVGNHTTCERRLEVLGNAWDDMRLLRVPALTATENWEFISPWGLRRTRQVCGHGGEGRWKEIIPSAKWWKD